MATYRLKRKTFSEEGEKKGMGLGTKLALGAATVGGGLLAAKHGAFGAGAQRSVGKGMMGLGMKQSGANTVAKADVTSLKKKLGDKAKNVSEETWKAKEEQFRNRALKQHEAGFKRADVAKRANEAKFGQQVAMSNDMKNISNLI